MCFRRGQAPPAAAHAGRRALVTRAVWAYMEVLPTRSSSACRCARWRARPGDAPPPECWGYYLEVLLMRPRDACRCARWRARLGDAPPPERWQTLGATLPAGLSVCCRMRFGGKVGTHGAFPDDCC